MKAWCPTCRLVDTVDEQWRCTWCETVTLDSLGHGTESTTLSVRTLHAIHERYAAGESLRELAAESHQHVQTLRQNLHGLGLPTRSRHSACVLTGMVRTPARMLREANPIYRAEITEGVVVEAYVRTGSIRNAASDLGISGCLVRNRLIAAGHPLRPWGSNSHNRKQAA